MKKILILLLMLILGIISYAKADDILGTWLIKENGKIVEIYKNENGEYIWINIEKDGNLFIKGTGNTEVGKYVRELHLIRQK